MLLLVYIYCLPVSKSAAPEVLALINGLSSPQFKFNMDNSVYTHTKWAPKVYRWMALKVRGFPSSSVMGGNSSMVRVRCLSDVNHSGE
jgi:hypothetical protein